MGSRMTIRRAYILVRIAQYILAMTSLSMAFHMALNSDELLINSLNGNTAIAYWYLIKWLMTLCVSGSLIWFFDLVAARLLNEKRIVEVISEI